MKSLIEIYYSHKNWLEDERHPNVQIERVISAEMADEADEYVKGLTAFNDNWKNILKDDVRGLNPYCLIAKILHGVDPWKSFDGISYYCNDGGFTDEEYMYIKHVDLVEDFFTCIQCSIRRYFGEDIDIIGWIKQKQDADTSTPTLLDADTKNSGKKGREPAPPFRDYFINSEDADIILPILHELLDGKKGTARAKFIVAIIGTWIKEPLHQSVHNEFNNGKKDSTYEERYGRHFGDYSTKKQKCFSKEELEDVRKLIQSKIPQ